ncbi:glycosyltransferase [Flavobacterium pedocola]
MIRVLNIVETIGYGGVERRRLSMAKLLDKSRFELKIICTKTEGNFADEIRAQGVEVIEVGILKQPFDFKHHEKVKAIIEDFQPHIIHGAVFEGVTMAVLNGFSKKVPIIIAEETSDPQNRSWKGNLLMKAFCTMSDAVVGVSPATIAYLLEKLRIRKSKVHLITNGVALPEKVSPEEVEKLRTDLGLNENHIIIGSVGRMLSDANKRFSDLIKAFAVVVSQNPDARLVLVGEGNEKPNYIALSEELGISDKVVFAGYQNEVSKYYELFDVFSLVSSHESFGLVLAEAMLHHLPIVATNVGGMQYIVVDGGTGFLVEKYDVDAIADRLKKLCDEVPLRKQMGEKGFQRAIENYTEERYVQQVGELYDKLLKKKGL